MKPISMKLIAFVLAATAVLCAAAWVGAGTTGTISGVVKSDDGKPISGANIIVSGTKLTTVTDANGYFVITNIPPGDYDVRAEMVGYASATADRVQLTMDATSKVNFDMKPEAIKETTAVVTRSRPMIAPDQINTLNLVTSSQENLTRTDPTSVNTVPGVLSTLPGVVVEPNGTGLTHIRGGKPEQIGYYIEGIPLTDPNLGTFSDNLFATGVSKFQVYTGGFGAEYGNALGCVMNEVKKTGDVSSGIRTTAYAGGGAYRNAIAEVGGGSPGAFSYYASTILQHNDFSGTPILASQTYDDSIAKLVWPSKNDTLTLLALSGTLKGDLGTYFPVPGDFMRQRYTIAGAVWSHNFSPSSFMTIRPYYIHVNALQSMRNSGVVFFGGPYWLEDTSDQTGVTVGYTNQLNERQLLKFGGSVLRSDNNQFTYIVGPYANADVNTLQAALYAEQRFKFSTKWTMSTGARYEGITYDRKGKAYVSADKDYTGASIPDVTESALMPRLGLSYAQDARTAWKITWGKYMKFVPANSVQTIYTDPTAEESQAGIGSTSSQRATAGDISFEKQISDAMAYRITPFYSNYTHLGSLAPDEHGILRYLDLGKAESRGVEFSLRRKMSANWQGWLSYTYATIKADNSGTGPLTYTSWDRRHSVSLVAEHKKGNWDHTLRTDLGSGLADVYPTDATARRANPYVVFTYGLTFNLPKGSSLGDSLSLGIYNILNNRQVAEYQDGAANSSGGFTTGERSVSLGFSKGF